MPEDKKIVAVCVDCRAGFTEEETQGVDRCPGCGSPGLPMSPDNEVEVKINWHELHILCVWAEHHANGQTQEKEKQEMLKTVHAIAGAIQEQYPSRSALTLSGEIEQLRQAGIKIETSPGFPEGGPAPPSKH